MRMTDEAFPWIADGRAHPLPEGRVPDVRHAPPWTVEERADSFIIRDGERRVICYLYFVDTKQKFHRNSLTRDEAWLVCRHITAMPYPQAPSASNADPSPACGGRMIVIE